MKIVLTCEHAGNLVPVEYTEHFFDFKNELQTHRGYDLGALDLFKELEKLSDFSKFHQETRLLIELNRSLHHPKLFSEVSRNFSKEEKQKLIYQYYKPYREEVEQQIRNYIEAGEEVLHISVHSFTPSLNGEGRTADIGLLYDPSRNEEKQFCVAFREKLQRESKDLVVKMNYPYLGKADGFTTYLRKQFPEHYRGIELEVSQKFVIQKRMGAGIKEAVFNALEQLTVSNKQ